MSQGHGPGGPPRWPGPGHHGARSPSPFRGPLPPRGPAGWASPIPRMMTQSPPPFLIRPMVGGQSPSVMVMGSPRPASPSPAFGPPRWSPVPHLSHPPPPMAPRQFFRPIIPSPTPPPMMPPPMPVGESYPDVFALQLQPSYDMEFVYPPGMDPETMRMRQMAAERLMSQDDEDGEGPTTAQIIAAQSQDYIDERLAEYQATIQHLQGFQMFL